MDPKTVKGYKIEFTATPCQVSKLYPLQYSTEQLHLINKCVGDLFQKGMVSQLPEEQSKIGFSLNLFLFPKKDGGQRPVISLKALNEFVALVHFKMEGIHTLRDLIKPGNWLEKMYSI